jgi:cyclophilin family peptidyl-prolyl cis-trans isomerase/HEAT repeat protein
MLPSISPLKWSALFVFMMLCTPSPAARHLRRAAAGGGETSLRRILEIQEQRIAKDKILVNALSQGSRQAKAALLALGRIGDTSALDEIARILNRKDRDLKNTAAFALGVMGGETALKILMQQSQLQSDPEILATLYVAIGRAGSETAVPLLTNVIKESTNPKTQEAAAHGLGILWSGPSEKWDLPQGLLSRLAKLSTGPDAVALSAAFALSRYKGNPIQVPVKEVGEAIGNSQLVFARAFLCRVLAKVRAPLAAEILARELDTSPHSGVRIEAAKSLGFQDPTDASLSALGRALAVTQPNLSVAALESVGELGAKAVSLTEPVDALFKSTSSSWVRGAALKTLSRIDATAGRKRVLESLAGTSPSLLPAAIYSLAFLGTPTDLERLVGYLNLSDPRLVEEAVDGLGTLPDESFTPAIKVALKKDLERADVGLTSSIAPLVEKMKWKEFASTLSTSYRLFTIRDQIEAKVATLSALGTIGDYSNVELLQQGLKDPDRPVTVAAATALRSLTGKDESAKVPLNSTLSYPTPSQNDLDSAVRSQVTLRTSRGEIRMEMLAEAPVTAANFIRLVKQGFYRGKTFHRVVPNFVVQGGDPRGDGYGGPGYLIRDELSPVRHSRGIVGMATAGKDTGGSQFFINLSPNPHLDGRYTAFAEVTKGMETVDKLEVGDMIAGATVTTK